MRRPPRDRGAAARAWTAAGRARKIQGERPPGRQAPHMAGHQVDWRQPFPESTRGGPVTIGNFDGVHRGHTLLLAELRRQARALGGPAVAFTFDPHPLQLLRPDPPPPPLTTPADRARLLHEAGADEV